MKVSRIYGFLAAAMIVFSLIVGVDLPSAGQEGSGVGEHARVRPQQAGLFAKVPEKVRLRANPLAGDPDAVPAGKKLYGQHCAQCHGQAAEGGAKAPNLRAGAMRGATPGTIFWIMSNGVVRKGMPVWSKLPEAQRWQITSYIKSLSPLNYAEPAVPNDGTTSTGTRH